MNNGFILSKRQYYILSLTWGLPLTLMGLVCGLCLLVAGKTSKKHLYGYYFIVGKNWGGANLGIITIVCKDSSTELRNHEFGHSIQNCIFGPFTIFFVSLPSCIRYWIRSISNKELPPYDYAWFEGMATMFGERYSARIKQ